MEDSRKGIKASDQLQEIDFINEDDEFINLKSLAYLRL
jgi:hypothetical protein